MTGDTTMAKPDRDHPVVCLFGNDTGTPDTKTLDAAGILEHGRYKRVFSIAPDEMITQANGTGLLDVRHTIQGNESVSGRTVAAGTFTFIEQVKG